MKPRHDFSPGQRVAVQGFHAKVDGAEGVVIPEDITGSEFVHVSLDDASLASGPGFRWLFKPEELVKI